MTRSRADHRLSLLTALEYGGIVRVDTVVGALGLSGDAADELAADMLAIGLARAGGELEGFALIVSEANGDALRNYLIGGGLAWWEAPAAPPDVPATPAPPPSPPSKDALETLRRDVAMRLLETGKYFSVVREGEVNILVSHISKDEAFDLFDKALGTANWPRETFMRYAQNGHPLKPFARLFNCEEIRWPGSAGGTIPMHKGD